MFVILLACICWGRDNNNYRANDKRTMNPMLLLALCVIGHHGRSKSEVAVPVSLSAESSSVSAGGGPQPSSTKSRKGSTSSNQSGPPGNLAQLQNRVSRTVSRNDDEDQVSAV